MLEEVFFSCWYILSDSFLTSYFPSLVSKKREGLGFNSLLLFYFFFSFYDSSNEKFFYSAQDSHSHFWDSSTEQFPKNAGSSLYYYFSAAETFNRLLYSYPDLEYVVEVYSRLGFIYKNLEIYDLALKVKFIVK